MPPEYLPALAGQGEVLHREPQPIPCLSGTFPTDLCQRLRLSWRWGLGQIVSQFLSLYVCVHVCLLVSIFVLMDC